MDEECPRRLCASVGPTSPVCTSIAPSAGHGCVPPPNSLPSRGAAQSAATARCTSPRRQPARTAAAVSPPAYSLLAKPSTAKVSQPAHRFPAEDARFAASPLGRPSPSATLWSRSVASSPARRLLITARVRKPPQTPGRASWTHPTLSSIVFLPQAPARSPNPGGPRLGRIFAQRRLAAPRTELLRLGVGAGARKKESSPGCPAPGSAKAAKEQGCEIAAASGRGHLARS